MATTVTAGTDYTITATLTDSDGDPVTGATGTVEMKNEWNRFVAGVDWPESLSDQADGTYTYTLAGSLLKARRHYHVTAKFTDPGNAQAMLTLICVP